MVESAGADQEDVVDIVLADGEGTATDGAERNAMHSDTQTYEIDVPMLSVVKKSAVIADPVNCPMASPLDPTANPLDPNNIPLCTGNPKRIPGAIVEYSITVYNDSTTAATGVTMTDVLTAAEVDFIAGSIVNTSGTAQAYAAGTRTVTASGITVPAKSGATQGQAVVKFRVLIL